MIAIPIKTKETHSTISHSTLLCSINADIPDVILVEFSSPAIAVEISTGNMELSIPMMSIPNRPIKEREIPK